MIIFLFLLLLLILDNGLPAFHHAGDVDAEAGLDAGVEELLDFVPGGRITHVCVDEPLVVASILREEASTVFDHDAMEFGELVDQARGGDGIRGRGWVGGEQEETWRSRGKGERKV